MNESVEPASTKPAEARLRVAIAGLLHETNTFAPFGAFYDDFARADGWPAITFGADILDVFPPLEIPIGGFIAAAKDTCDLVPIVWAAAEPTSFVSDDAFERIATEICSGIAAAGKLDAIFLDLHGAMAVQSYEDGEGELLRRVRAFVGPELPVVISLDLHANVTETMVELCDGIALFRTYPHIDMAATGQRAFTLLGHRIRHGRALAKAFRKPPFLIPLAAQCTDFEPCKSLYQKLPGYLDAAVFNVDMALGFPLADIRDCGPAIVAYGTDAAAVAAAADKACAAMLEAESMFEMPLLSVGQAVEHALLHGGRGETIVLADVQDNPGCGGTSDTVGLLRGMVEGGLRNSALGLLWDPETAASAHEAGVGAEMDVRLGGRFGYDAEPYRVRVRVEQLWEGVFTANGPFLAGVKVDLGRMARLRVLDPRSDVQVAVSTIRYQCLDQDLLRAVGIEPKEQSVVAVKSTIHFRADFAPMAKEIVMVESPGAHWCRSETLPYERLREGVRKAPISLTRDPLLREKTGSRFHGH
ncbi:M81 family metallopeptidase [Mesorhizobium sp. C277A]|uniref:M81 family metallopeptidase n=1 Tax=unclassified Mesorhizobium TaxID=325217 RepID=UPI0003CE4268|nr:M81 family metallopeptidase [Mesorhizobium sp. LSJC277A00]ESW63448.1 MlrC domain-containing protein [Mesorhizobium sp. LSJC277A00]